jgi:hypothetical protein
MSVRDDESCTWSVTAGAREDIVNARRSGSPRPSARPPTCDRAALVRSALGSDGGRHQSAREAACAACELFGGRYAALVHSLREQLGAPAELDAATLARVRLALASS